MEVFLPLGPLPMTARYGFGSGCISLPKSAASSGWCSRKLLFSPDSGNLYVTRPTGSEGGDDFPTLTSLRALRHPSEFP